MKNKFLLLTITLFCPFSSKLWSAQASEFNLKGLPLTLPSQPERQEIAKTSEVDPKEVYDEDYSHQQGGTRKKPRTDPTEPLVQLLTQPHYLPYYPTSLREHFLSKKANGVCTRDPERPFSHPVFPFTFNHHHFRQATPLSPQTNLLVSLVKKACTSQADLKETRCAIFDRFKPNEGNLPNANIIVNTNCGLTPLLVFAIRASKEQVLPDDLITIIRILAEKSSDEIRTLTLNDPTAYHRIQATPGLQDFRLFKREKVCTCESCEDEKE